MKEQSWQTKKRIEADYANSMMKMSKFFFSKAMEGLDSYDEQLEVLRSAPQKPLFLKWAQTLASRMVTGLQAASAGTWREAASEGTEGKKIHRMLRHEMEGINGAKVNEIVQNNASLISSLPLQVSKTLATFIQKQQMAGKRFEGMKFGKIVAFLTKKRIALIARTETSKASTALTRARAEDLDLRWYIWRTSKDARVRASHNYMDRVLVSWDEAPAPEILAGIKSKLGHYHAGDAPNDRCYPQPVLSLESIKWPSKVYYVGSIKYMTRSNFEKIAGFER